MSNKGEGILVCGRQVGWCVKNQPKNPPSRVGVCGVGWEGRRCGGVVWWQEVGCVQRGSREKGCVCGVVAGSVCVCVCGVAKGRGTCQVGCVCGCVGVKGKGVCV